MNAHLLPILGTLPPLSDTAGAKRLSDSPQSAVEVPIRDVGSIAPLSQATTVAAEGGKVAQGKQGTGQERKQVAAAPAPPRFSQQHGQVQRHSTEQGGGRQVAPEDQLLIVRLPFEKGGVRPSAIRGGDVVQHARARLEQDAVASPVQPKRQVHVLEVSAEGRGKSADAEEAVAAIESAGGGGAKDETRPQVVGVERLAVTVLAGHAAEVVAVAGAVDTGRPRLTARPAPPQGRHPSDRLVGEGRQRCLGPARTHLGVVVEQLDNAMGRGGDAGVGGDTEAAAAFEPDHANALELLDDCTDRAIGGSVINDNDLGVWRPVPQHTAEAGAQQVAAAVAGDDNGETAHAPSPPACCPRSHWSMKAATRRRAALNWPGRISTGR